MMKSNFKFSSLAILLGALIAVSQSAFKPAHPHRFDTVQWIFTGTSLAQDKSASNYQMVDASHPIPGNCAGTALPCYITVDGDLQTYLNNNSSADIRDNADETRD